MLSIWLKFEVGHISIVLLVGCAAKTALSTARSLVENSNR